MIRVLVWDLREQYDSYINKLKFEEMKGNISIVGITSQDKFRSSFDGYKVYNIYELAEGVPPEIDCVVAYSTDFHFQTTRGAVHSIYPNIPVIPARILDMPCFDFVRYWSVFNSKVSIISPSCWGGLAYNAMALPFLLPLINTHLFDEDYLRLLSDFHGYISMPLLLEKEMDCRGCPVGKLGDVRINFVHYENFEIAKKIWERRVQRINWNNLLIYMPVSDRKTAERFLSLPLKGRKICFSAENLHMPGVYWLRDYRESIECRRVMGDRSFESFMHDQVRRRLYAYDDPIGNRGAKCLKAFDLLKLMNNEEFFMR